MKFILPVSSVTYSYIECTSGLFSFSHLLFLIFKIGTYVDTRAPKSALINEHSLTAIFLFLGTLAGKTSYSNIMQALIDKIHLDRGINSLPNVEAIYESIALRLTRCRAPYVTLAENGEPSVNVEEVANHIIRAMVNCCEQLEMHIVLTS